MLRLGRLADEKRNVRHDRTAARRDDQRNGAPNKLRGTLWQQATGNDRRLECGLNNHRCTC